MRDDEYAAAWMIAASLWPESTSPRTERVRQAWRGTLDMYVLDELGGAFEQLARTESRFPPLSAVHASCIEIRERNRAQERKRLKAASRRNLADQSVDERVAEFDWAAAERRDEYRAEFRLFAYGDPTTERPACRPWTWQGITEEQWLADTEAWILRVGPYEDRARALMTGEITPGEGLEAFHAARAAAAGPERVGDVLARQAVREADLPGILAQLTGQPPPEESA